VPEGQSSSRKKKKKKAFALQDCKNLGALLRRGKKRTPGFYSKTVIEQEEGSSTQEKSWGVRGSWESLFFDRLNARSEWWGKRRRERGIDEFTGMGNQSKS